MPEGAGAVKQILTVGIMGAGRMAQGYDGPGSAKAMSHMGAIMRHPRFSVGGIFDIDAQKAEAAEARWQCPPSPRGRSTWLAQGWDIVCIATPSAHHATDLADVIKSDVRGILAEKPLVLEPAVGEELLIRAGDAGLAILVNYPRRYHSEVRRLKALAAEGGIGAPLSFCFTGNGDRIDGVSHALDLLHQIWGFSECRGLAGAGSALLVELRGPAGACTGLVHTETRFTTYLWDLTVQLPDTTIRWHGSPEFLTLETPQPHPEYEGYLGRTEGHSASMEDEDLLTAVWSQLAAAVDDPVVARRCLAAEVSAHTLFRSYLNVLADSD